MRGVGRRTVGIMVRLGASVVHALHMTTAIPGFDVGL